MSKSATKTSTKSGIQATAGAPLERATLSVPANAVSFPVPPHHVVKLTDLWVNPGSVHAQMLDVSRYIQAPLGDYREALLPARAIKGRGQIPTGEWLAEPVAHPSIFIVRSSHVRKIDGQDVTFGSFAVSFARSGDLFKMEFEDVGAPPTDLRLAFQLVPPAQKNAGSKKPAAKKKAK
nr:hypothetical protein [uncultured Dongia sp.]